MTDAPVLVEMTDGVATAVLNRPDVLNALDLELAEALDDVMTGLQSDPDVRAIVVTGAGRGFCAGGDLKFLHGCLEAGDVDRACALVEAGGRIARAILGGETPVLAAVGGAAIGGGCNLALACGMRIASEGARFGQMFHRLGLAPDWGGTWSLPRIVGRGQALRLFLADEPVDAAEALRIGLVSEVVPDDDLRDRAMEIAAGWAAAPQQAVASVKGTLAGAGALEDLAAALDREEAEQRRLFQTTTARRRLREFGGGGNS